MTTQDGPILVIGATGRQGGAVARELLSRGRGVHALTRTPGTPAAKQLAQQGAIVIQGDLDDPASIRRAMSGVRGVFSVQAHDAPGGVAREVRQGIAVAEAAKDADVAHVVYTSVDGAERHSGVAHFESKRVIEQRLEALRLPTTVLRPTGLMENFATHARPEVVDGTLLVRLALRPYTPLQMVACADIGAFAADAFERPQEYIGAAVALAGDELTGSQIAEAFQTVTATPARYEERPLQELRAFSEDLARMWEWIGKFGYATADIPALRARRPGLRTLPDWLEKTGWRAAVAA